MWKTQVSIICVTCYRRETEQVLGSTERRDSAGGPGKAAESQGDLSGHFLDGKDEQAFIISTSNCIGKGLKQGNG